MSQREEILNGLGDLISNLANKLVQTRQDEITRASTQATRDQLAALNLQIKNAQIQLATFEQTYKALEEKYKQLDQIYQQKQKALDDELAEKRKQHAAALTVLAHPRQVYLMSRYDSSYGSEVFVAPDYDKAKQYAETKLHYNFNVEQMSDVVDISNFDLSDERYFDC
jgi:ribosomal protein L16 Arg81 hydroxylase